MASMSTPTGPDHAQEAVAELRRCSRTHFDPVVVDALVAAVSSSS